MHEWHEWSHFFSLALDYAGYLWSLSYAPFWNALKSFSCVWIFVSIMKFKPEEGMRYRRKTTTSATIIAMLCVAEFSRVFTGLAVGVSPFMAMFMFFIARAIHVNRGNIARLNLA